MHILAVQIKQKKSAEGSAHAGGLLAWTASPFGGGGVGRKASPQAAGGRGGAWLRPEEGT